MVTDGVGISALDAGARGNAAGTGLETATQTLPRRRGRSRVAQGLTSLAWVSSPMSSTLALLCPHEAEGKHLTRTA